MNNDYTHVCCAHTYLQDRTHFSSLDIPLNSGSRSLLEIPDNGHALLLPGAVPETGFVNILINRAVYLSLQFQEDIYGNTGPQLLCLVNAGMIRLTMKKLVLHFIT